MLAQAHDLDLPRCCLGDHDIPNGQHYVLMKFTGGARYAVCFDCANPHCPTSRKWREPDHE